MILLHGYGFFGAAYNRITSKLSLEYDVIALDLPGFGFSYRNKFVEDLSTTKEWLGYFIDCIDRFV